MVYENTKLICENTKMTCENTKLIYENTKLIYENTKLIYGNSKYFMKVDENLLGFHSMGFHGQCIRSQSPLIFSSWEKAPAEMPKTTPSARLLEKILANAFLNQIRQEGAKWTPEHEGCFPLISIWLSSTKNFDIKMSN